MIFKNRLVSILFLKAETDSILIKHTAHVKFASRKLQLFIQSHVHSNRMLDFDGVHT